MFLQQLAGAGHQRLSTDQRGEAPSQTADTRLAVRVHRQMSDLSGETGGTPVDLAVEDVPQADPGRHLDVGKVVDVTARAPPALGEGTQVGVVVDKHGRVESLVQPFEPTPPAPLGEDDLGQTVGIFGIDRTRDAHADPDQPLRLVLAHRERRLTEIYDSRSRPLRIGTDRVILCSPGDHPAAQIGEGNRHVRRSDVHAEDDARVVLEFEHDGAPSATGRAGAHLSDEPRLQETSDDLRDGRAG